MVDPVVKWDIQNVVRWFNQNGFTGYNEILKGHIKLDLGSSTTTTTTTNMNSSNHGVDGEALVHLDNEALKDLGVRALGKRLLILKAIYFLKIQNDIPISSRHYVPQTVSVEPDVMIPKHAIIKQYEDQLQYMREEMGKLAKEMNKVRDDLRHFHRQTLVDSKLSLHHTGSLRRPKPIDMEDPSMTFSAIPSATSARLHPSTPLKSPTPSTKSTSSPIADSFMRDPLGHQNPNDNSKLSPRGSEEQSTNSAAAAISGANGATDGYKPHLRVYGSNGIQRKFESYKSIKIDMEDVCSTVLPSILEKYHIHDDWKNYSLHIDYISDLSDGSRTERPVNLDEKPLLLLSRLRHENRDPKFFLKNLRSGGTGTSDYFGNGTSSLSPVNGHSHVGNNSSGSINTNLNSNGSNNVATNGGGGNGSS
ncbi:hypothetical protein H4219_000855 [Mycoemilia scoparia]|uniref:SAM domain-containing protein n=1 Tax=Mycoemilia scoparia TaxID=417184 RepID=A0A9W8DSN6_9FUNG|nr:hypothetical protein H4219_000855 [Mycoemilia scoparia]